MIDLHCHILPGVDDGAGTMEDALTMARMAAESGVTHLIATPHCNLPYAEDKNYLSPALISRFVELRTRIQEAGIPLKLYPGSEILCTPDLPELLQQDKLIPLGNSNYLLVEFLFDETLSYIDDMLEAIVAEGMRPIIAHPERYESVQRNPRVIERWFVRGHIIQLNKGSILGRLGRRTKHTAQWILSHGLAHVIASDAHSPVARTPQMSELIRYITDHCPPEYANILLNENPSRILNGLPVVQAR